MGNASAERLHFSSGQVVQEFGWDDDVDDEVRLAIEDITGTELADEYYGDVSNAAIIWWRADDGDLADMLVDSMNMLEDGGPIWVFTPKSGRPGFLSHADIADAANLTGLHTMSTFELGSNWSATALANRGKTK